MKRGYVIPTAVVLILLGFWTVAYGRENYVEKSTLNRESGYTVARDVKARGSPLAFQQPSALIPGGLYGTDGYNLYSIDKTTGVATLIGPHGNVEYFIGALAFNDAGTLYGINAGLHPKLFEIDIDTGSAKVVGNLKVGFVFEGGLAFNLSGVLFGVNQEDQNGHRLFTINTKTGAGTIVGPFPGEIRNITGLSFDGQTLFALNGRDNTFGSINTTDGVYSSIGDTGAAIGGTGGLAVDPRDGKVYAAFREDAGLYTINKTTGAATLISTDVVDFNVNYGLAFAPLSETIYMPLILK